MLLLALAFIILTPQSGLAYFRVDDRTAPYLVLPNAVPVRSGNVSASFQSVSSASISAISIRNSILAFRRDVLSIVNQERQKRGIATLTRNPILERSAQIHANDMAKRNFFSHIAPDGTDLEDRIRATGYFVKPCNCSVSFPYGENIAKGQKNAKDVMSAWMRSSTHRENILNGKFKEFGLGYSGGIWVQNFGGMSVKEN
ncbi:CAP domain-containing protein [Candidatus Peregrinibacteria bacterium]|nr:CAP domain-containing protein [Candidatus Peregrinibacteria bacterium]